MKCRQSIRITKTEGRRSWSGKMSHNKQKAAATAICDISDWARLLRGLLMKMEMAAIRIRERVGSQLPRRHLHSQSQRELSTQIYYLPSPDSGRSFFCFKRVASPRLSLAHSREQQHALVAVRALRTLWLRSAASSRPIRTHPTYSTLLREMSRPNA